MGSSACGGWCRRAWMRRCSRNGRPLHRRPCGNTTGAVPIREEHGAVIVPTNGRDLGRTPAQRTRGVRVFPTPLTRVDAVPDPSSRGPRRLAALLTGLQALALAGFAVYYVVELVLGEGSDAIRVLMSALLILLGGVGLGLLARGWLGSAQWPRTPTLVWNVHPAARRHQPRSGQPGGDRMGRHRGGAGCDRRGLGRPRPGRRGAARGRRSRPRRLTPSARSTWTSVRLAAGRRTVRDRGAGGCRRHRWPRQQVVRLTRRVEQQPAPVPGHVDVETAEPSQRGPIDVVETTTSPSSRSTRPVISRSGGSNRAVVEKVGVVDQDGEVGTGPAQPHEEVGLVASRRGPRQEATASAPETSGRAVTTATGRPAVHRDSATTRSALVRPERGGPATSRRRPSCSGRQQQGMPCASSPDHDGQAVGGRPGPRSGATRRRARARRTTDGSVIHRQGPPPTGRGPAAAATAALSAGWRRAELHLAPVVHPHRPAGRGLARDVGGAQPGE